MTSGAGWARAALRGLVVALLLGGCHPVKPVISAATLRASDLPSDLPSLLRRAGETFDPGDVVALENTLVVLDKALGVEPRSYEALWQWGRAAFWLADAAAGRNNRRAWFAEQGALHAERAIAVDGARVEGHYYRGLGLGYLAKTRTLGAVELIGPMYKEAQAAQAVDERFDHAGPLRLLGGVLTNAPGWPASVGDSDEGAERLARAVELAPDYPLNHLYYGEALIKVGKPAEAEAQLQEAARQLAAPGYGWMKARVQAELDEQLQRARARQGRPAASG